MQGTGHDLLHHPLSASRFSGEKAAVRSRGPSPASSLCEPGFVPPSSMVPSSPRYRAAWSVYHAWESGCFNTASEVVPRSIAPALAGGSRSLRLRSVTGKPGHVLRTKVFYTPGKRLSHIQISEPTRQAEISYAVFCLKKDSEIKTMNLIVRQHSWRQYTALLYLLINSYNQM